jgi:hypothetical protein
MPELLTIELKSDLERIYKITGDILNALDSGGIRCESGESGGTLEQIKFNLMDIGGTLQKDIFNCDYLITKCKGSGEDGGKCKERRA